MDATTRQIAAVVEAVSKKNKYRTIEPELIATLAHEELAKGRKIKSAIKEVSSRLHQAGAAYFTSSSDYDAWLGELAKLPAELNHLEVKKFCLEKMGQHSSTQERLPIIAEFFQQTLASISPVESILDLACGLNPLALPWMPVSTTVRYSGNDIFSDMTGFLNQFSRHFGIKGSFSMRDITKLQFPKRAQVAFLLKTLPCLEQLKKGVSSRLLDAVPAETLLISYPIRSLGGRTKGMGKTYETQFNQLVDGRGWQVERFEFSTELAFLIKK